MSCFNNTNPASNGEITFFNKIKEKCNVIFDVGSRSESIFLNNNGKNVHYFEPVSNFITILKKKENNENAKFNEFGLSDSNGVFDYFPSTQSFLDRSTSMKIHTKNNNWKPGRSVTLQTKTAFDYINDNNIGVIDFLKIDTEGYEYKVILGFKELIKNVKFIQFEYGGTYLDNNCSLSQIIEYLKKNGFVNFSYLHKNGEKLITDTKDHYQYCNIVCYNSKYLNP